jgi:hypothetical protein
MQPVLGSGKLQADVDGHASQIGGLGNLEGVRVHVSCGAPGQERFQEKFQRPGDCSGLGPSKAVAGQFGPHGAASANVSSPARRARSACAPFRLRATASTVADDQSAVSAASAWPATGKVTSVHTPVAPCPV